MNTRRLLSLLPRPHHERPVLTASQVAEQLGAWRRHSFEVSPSEPPLNEARSRLVATRERADEQTLVDVDFTG